MNVKILDFQARGEGALIGYVKVGLDGGLILVELSVLHGKRGSWVPMPTKARTNGMGDVSRYPDGAIIRVKVVDFGTQAEREAFSSTVIAALREAYPEALPWSPDAGGRRPGWYEPRHPAEDGDGKEC